MFRPMLRLRGNRRGNTLVLCAILMVVLFGLVAFAVDIGYVLTARSQLQTSADAAAMAACWELVDENSYAEDWEGPDEARETASLFAAMNLVAGAAPALQNANDQAGDVLVGHLDNPHDPSAVMTYNNPGEFNAVQVRVRRHGDQNGEVGLHFARVLGINSLPLEAQATAALVKHIRGFRLPPQSPDKIMILPITLDRPTWESYTGAGTGFSDDWTYDPATKTVTAGPDGIREINLYPEGAGSSASRGTVDIGGHDDLGDVARQIVQGVNAADLAYHGGKLELDSGGQLSLGGQNGVSTSLQESSIPFAGSPESSPSSPTHKAAGEAEKPTTRWSRSSVCGWYTSIYRARPAPRACWCNQPTWSRGEQSPRRRRAPASTFIRQCTW
jgi:hypothetical protein